MKRALLPCLAIALIVVVVIGCGNVHRPSPSASVPSSDQLPDESLARGQHAFMINCHQCHPGGASGLAPAINDKPLPEGLIKLQIRKGLGAMPAFNEQHINDADVDAIVKYLKYLRDQKHVS